MSLAVALPHLPDAVTRTGPYPRALDVVSRERTAVQRQLWRGGLAGYRPLTQATVLALAQRAPSGSAVYDIGAGIGLYAALADAVFGRSASRGRGGWGGEGLRVHAFEADPERAELARKVRQRNGLGFAVHECALARECGGTEAVRTTTVDAFASEQAPRPFLLRAGSGGRLGDGGEVAAALEGALGTIRRARPWIVAEPSGDGTALRPVLEQLAALGYGFAPLRCEWPWVRGNAASFAGGSTGSAAGAAEGGAWLLAPEPPGEGFQRAVRCWLGAVLECDASTNRHVAEGGSFSGGLGDPYAPAVPVRGRRWLPRGRLERAPRPAGQR